MARSGSIICEESLQADLKPPSPARSLPKTVQGKTHFVQCSGLQCFADQLLPTSW